MKIMLLHDGEVVKNLEANLLTFFWMELSGKNIILPDCRRERTGVIGLGGRNFRIFRDDVIRMHEVNGRIFWQVEKVRGKRSIPQVIPSHVRNLQSGPRFEPNDFARKEVEPVPLTVLVTLREQELQPEADSEKRLALSHVIFDGISQPGRIQTSDGIAKRSDAGQHEFVAFGYAVRIAGNFGVKANFLEALLNASKIAHSVVNDED